MPYQACPQWRDAAQLGHLAAAEPRHCGSPQGQPALHHEAPFSDPCSEVHPLTGARSGTVAVLEVQPGVVASHGRWTRGRDAGTNSWHEYPVRAAAHVHAPASAARVMATAFDQPVAVAIAVAAAAARHGSEPPLTRQLAEIPQMLVAAGPRAAPVVEQQRMILAATLVTVAHPGSEGVRSQHAAHVHHCLAAARSVVGASTGARGDVSGHVLAPA